MAVGLWPFGLRRLCQTSELGVFANDQRPTTNDGWSLRLVLALLFRFLDRFAELFDGGNLRWIE
jgi:hypothetical protein